MLRAIETATRSACCSRNGGRFTGRSLICRGATEGHQQTLRFARSNNNTEVPARLFVVHTFNSLLTKLLAAEIVTAHGLASGRAFAGDLVAIEDDLEILRRLRDDIEDGGLFEATGVHGFVEEPIFSWYLDAATNKRHRFAIGTAIRDVLTQLSLYRTDKLTHSRDVLRDFYQDLVPRTFEEDARRVLHT